MTRLLVIGLLVISLGACSTNLVNQDLVEEYDDSPYVHEGTDSYAITMHDADEVPSQKLSIHFLDVGTGSCHLIDCPGDDVILNDCGESKTAKDKKDQAIKEIERIRNGRKINLVLSHPDGDHFSLVKRIPAIAIKKIYYGDAWEKYGTLPEDWKTSVAKDKDEPYEMNFHKHPYPDLTCGPAKVGILTVNAKASPADPDNHKNGNSLVLYIEMNKFSAILSGDAVEETEAAVLDNFKDLKPVTIISGSHHGAKSHGSNGVHWVKKVNPNIVVFSANSANTRFGHPRREVVERYVAHSSRLLKTFPRSTTCGVGENKKEQCEHAKAIFSTYDQGNITIETDGVNYSLQCSKNAQDCSLLKSLDE
jgi:beta-lactamase superfamily II metal-dependent hydrolase